MAGIGMTDLRAGQRLSGKGLAAATVAALAAVMLALPARAQQSSSATSGAAATVLAPFEIALISDLGFGSLRVRDTAGTVVITFEGARSATGGVQLRGGADFHAGEFLVTGVEGTPYRIGLPSNPTAGRDLSAPEPGVTLLEVTDLDPFSANVGPGLDGLIGQDGTDTILLGGTLQVPLTAKQGNYRGDFTLTLIFQ